MSDLRATSATVSIPYIYLRSRAPGSGAPKKVRFPSSYEALVRIANTHFGSKVKVQSIITEDGTAVQSLTDVLPGCTLSVSSQPIAAASRVVVAPSPPQPPAADPIAAKTSFNRLFGPPEEATPPPPGPVPAPKDRASSTPVPREGSARSSLPPSEREPPPEAPVPPPSDVAQKPRGGASKTLRADDEQVPPPIVHFEPEPEQVELSDTRSGGLSRGSLVVHVGDEPEPLESAAAPTEEAEPKQVREVEEESDEPVLQKLISELVAPNALPNAVDSVPALADLLANLPNLEQQQIVRWYQKGLAMMMEQGFAPLTETLLGLNEMIGHARLLLATRHFPSICGSGYRLHLAIVGPRNSGKSTFLRVLSEEILVDLILTEEWKKTFVFLLDFASLVASIDDAVVLYRTIVSLTFRQCHWQAPHLIPHLRMIQECFESVVTLQKPPQFLRSFAIDESTRVIAAALHQIGVRLSVLWNNPTALLGWLEAVFLFPTEVATAFGFKKSLLLVDHFDLIDFPIFPSPLHFTESPAQFSLSDIIKRVMSRTNFVVSCQDEERFYSLFPALASGVESDFQGPLELVSLVGLLPEVPHEDKQFKLELEGDLMPFVFTADMCGRIPAYVHVWDEVNAVWDAAASSEGGDTGEAEAVLAGRFEELMDMLFVQEQDDNLRLEITRCRRTQRPSKSN
jgi:hypothetical protein